MLPAVFGAHVRRKAPPAGLSGIVSSALSVLKNCGGEYRSTFHVPCECRIALYGFSSPSSSASSSLALDACLDHNEHIVDRSPQRGAKKSMAGQSGEVPTKAVAFYFIPGLRVGVRSEVRGSFRDMALTNPKRG